MTEQEKIKAEIETLQARLEELEREPELKKGDVCEVTEDGDFSDDPVIVRFEHFGECGSFYSNAGVSWSHYRKLKIALEWEVVPEDDIDYEKGDKIVCLHKGGKTSLRLAKNLVADIDFEKPVVKFIRLPRG